MILRRFGPKGLYTSTLFKFQKPFLSHLDDALELGRSSSCRSISEISQRFPFCGAGSILDCAASEYTKLFGPSASAGIIMALAQTHCRVPER